MPRERAFWEWLAGAINAERGLIQVVAARGRRILSSKGGLTRWIASIAKLLALEIAGSLLLSEFSVGSVMRGERMPAIRLIQMFGVTACEDGRLADVSAHGVLQW